MTTRVILTRARFYDPLVGQFIQPDSIVPDPLNPLAWNRFGYVYNNAVNFTDPSGHGPVLAFFATVAIAGALNVIVSSATDPGYTLGQAGIDFLIGAGFGAVGFFFGLVKIPIALRLIGYGTLTTAEGGLSAYFNPRKSFTTNDALWAFGSGVIFGLGGHYIGRYFDRRITEINEMYKIEMRYYERSVKHARASLREMEDVYRQGAISVARFQQQYPKSSLGATYLAKYRALSLSLYRPPLPKPTPPQHIVSSIDVIAALLGGFLADNEYMGLFDLPKLISNPQIIVP